MHGSQQAHDVLEYIRNIIDARQGQGLGTELLRRLVRIGRDEGLSRIVATIALDNLEMQQVSRRVGFTVRDDYADRIAKAELTLLPREHADVHGPS